MTDIKISTLSQSTVLYLYSERETIDFEPEYQRDSDIWPLSKQQLLIDSVINGFDLPKFYFHEHQIPLKKAQLFYRFGVIDGKQRLLALWNFIEGKIHLSTDFNYFRNASLNVGGMTYQEISAKHPDLKMRFDAYNLSVISINSPDLNLVEEMFFRLNEAEPLNAPEKRNARPGAMPKMIRDIASHNFFERKVKIGGARYKHYDLAAKFLLFEKENSVTDTKKAKLDKFVDENQDEATANALGLKVRENLKKLNDCFVEQDALLKNLAMITLFYLFFRGLRDEQTTSLRKQFSDFEQLRRSNRQGAESDEFGKIDMELIEFDRLSQSPNDKSALEFRLSVLRKHVSA
jgi:hypothetical protein